MSRGVPGSEAEGRPEPGGEDTAAGGSGSPVRVLAAVIRREGAYLVGRRPVHKRHGGLFEFPGGKVRPGESDRHALARELAEELALELAAAGDTLFSTEDPGAPFRIHFVAARVRGHPQALEHEELRWATAEELASGILPLAPSDARFVRDALDAAGEAWERRFR